MEANWHQQLLELSERFDLDEVKILCFTLKDQVTGLDFENLKGEGKKAKFVALIDFMERQQKVRELLGVIAQHRPDLEPEVSAIQAAIRVGIKKTTLPSPAPVPPPPRPAPLVRLRGGMARWRSLSYGAKVVRIVGFGLLLVALITLIGMLVAPVMTEWTKTLFPTAIAVATITRTPIATHTPTATPTATHTPPPPTPTPWVVTSANTFTYNDSARASITYEVASDPDRPNAIKLTCNAPAAGSYCVWGINLGGFDASKKSSLSFWVRGEKGGEQFVVGIKDIPTQAGDEPKVKLNTASAQWQPVSIPLQNFLNIKQQNLSVLENFSLSFTHELGSGTIYVDGFIFEP